MRTDTSARVWNDGKLYIYGSRDESPSYYCSYKHYVVLTDDLIRLKINKNALAEGKDEVFLLVAEGEAVEGLVLEIENTNSCYRFPIGTRKFMNQWSKQDPAHHCAIGVGHIADKIEKSGYIMQIKVVKVS